MIKRLKRLCPENTVFSRLNAPSVYLKIGGFDPAFNRSPAFNRENTGLLFLVNSVLKL